MHPDDVPPGPAQELMHNARGDLPGEYLRALRQVPLVAWDVETSGLDWRTARIGTCQLYAESVGPVVVSVGSRSKPANLASLLGDATVPKVFHHAPFDLRFMMHEWDVTPASIRCTKVASKLISPHAPNEAHSLQSLASHYLGVVLEKGAVRTSDWTARRLTPEQLRYAAADVMYLPSLLRALEVALSQAGLADLYDGCCRFLPTRVALELGDYPDVFAY
jgi:ribonuclease D